MNRCAVTESFNRFETENDLADYNYQQALDIAEEQESELLENGFAGGDYLIEVLGSGCFDSPEKMKRANQLVALFMKFSSEFKQLAMPIVQQNTQLTKDIEFNKRCK